MKLLHHKKIHFILILGVILLGTMIVMAQGPFWDNHAAPLDFYFNNGIDSHQQSKVNNQKLTGFLYMNYTGEYNNGIPVARQMNCSENPAACVAGWHLQGQPMQATLIQKNPRLWCVDPSFVPNQQGFTHFRWVNSPYAAHELAVGTTYSGYLLKRTALTTFYWQGGGQDDHERLVMEGIDSQSNITTDCSIGGGHGGDCHDGDDCGGHEDGGHEDGGCTDGEDCGGH